MQEHPIPLSVRVVVDDQLESLCYVELPREEEPREKLIVLATRLVLQRVVHAGADQLLQLVQRLTHLCGFIVNVVWHLLRTLPGHISLERFVLHAPGVFAVLGHGEWFFGGSVPGVVRKF